MQLSVVSYFFRSTTKIHTTRTLFCVFDCVESWERGKLSFHLYSHEYIMNRNIARKANCGNLLLAFIHSEFLHDSLLPPIIKYKLWTSEKWSRFSISLTLGKLITAIEVDDQVIAFPASWLFIHFIWFREWMNKRMTQSYTLSWRIWKGKKCQLSWSTKPR